MQYLRIIVLLSGVLVAVLWRAAPALAANTCEDWDARAAVVLDEPPVATVETGGKLSGVSFELRLMKGPITYYAGYWITLRDLGERVEIIDEDGNPVSLGRPDLWGTRLGKGVHAPLKWMLDVSPGGGIASVPASWLRLPKGGRYWIRVGFRFPNLTRERRKPGEPLLEPRWCEAWSDWTLVDFHPVVRSGWFSPGSPWAAWGVLLPHGVLVASPRSGTVYWYYWDGSLRKVSLGRTVEPLRKPEFEEALRRPEKMTAELLKRGSGFRDTDVIVDRAGIAHIVYAAEGGKTAYVKLGEKGVILERTELPGKKKLVRSDATVLVVEKPPDTKLK